MAKSLTEINLYFDCLLRELEQEHSFETLVSISDDILGSEFVVRAIKRYQEIIRTNRWYFPSLTDIDTLEFSERWTAVHYEYFQFACHVAGILSRTQSITALADATLLNQAIRSETMRGWVGKRSESGLDALIAQKIRAVESTLHERMSSDDIDELLLLCGVYVGDTNLVSAENEIVSEYASYAHLLSEDETDFINATTQESVSKHNLLRWYCRYSCAEFEKKYQTLHKILDSLTQNQTTILNQKSQIFRLKNLIPHDVRFFVEHTLDELKFLNHMNLNLEVKYSFKGWAGLMHMAVFYASAQKTGISSNVYQMHSEMR